MSTGLTWTDGQTVNLKLIRFIEAPHIPNAVTVWSAILTDPAGEGTGCVDAEGGIARCDDYLTSSSFHVPPGPRYSRVELINVLGGSLLFTLYEPLAEDLWRNLTLTVDGKHFHVEDGRFVGGDSATGWTATTWANTGLSWDDGDHIAITLEQRRPPSCGAGIAAHNPTGLQAFPGSGVLTLGWINPVNDNHVGYMVRWRKQGTTRWLNPNGSLGDLFNSPNANYAHHLTGLENGAAYDAQVRLVLWTVVPQAHDGGTWNLITGPCETSQWVSVTATPQAATPGQGATVWSATLTPKVVVSGINVGCNALVTAADCSSAAILSDDDFSHAGADYQIKAISLLTTGASIGRLDIVFDRVPADAAVRYLTLEVGSNSFPLSNSRMSTQNFTNDTRSWSSTGLTWNVDDPVQLRLSDPTAPTGITPTGSGPLLEGGPPVNVYLTLDQPARGPGGGTLGTYDGNPADHGYMPTYVTGARTAVLQLRAPEDDADNNCRDSVYGVTFPERVGGGKFIGARFAYAIKDNDGAEDTCQGLLGENYPKSLTLEHTVSGDPDGGITVTLLPRFDRSPPIGDVVHIGAGDGNTALLRSDPDDGSDGYMVIHNPRLEIHAGNDHPTSSGQIWGGTLTAGGVDGSHRGCENGSTTECSSTSVLTDDDFSYGGADFRITELKTVNSSGSLSIAFSSMPEALRFSGILDVDGALLWFAAADDLGSNYAEWNGAFDSGWSTGDTVRLRLAGKTDFPSRVGLYPNTHYVIEETETDPPTGQQPLTLYKYVERPANVQRNDAHNLVLTATSDFYGLSATPLTLNIGKLREHLRGGNAGTPCATCSRAGEVVAVHEAQLRFPELIAQMKEWRNDPQWVNEKAHTDRWDRALLAFGETVADQALTAMTAAEAQGFADQGWTRWVEVAKALRELENRPPTVSAAIADVTDLAMDTTWQVSLAGVFHDADGDALTITAASSNEAVATVSVATDGSSLTLAGVSEGTATITVTAEDGYSITASDDFQVEVAGKYAGLIAQMYQWRNDPQWVNEKAHTDRWDRALMAFGETVADQALTPMTAAEAREFADQGWTRWVEVATALRELQNRAPTLYAPFPYPTIVNETGSQEISLSGVFHDADGEDLTFTAASSDEAIATVTVATGHSSLTLNARAKGQATIAVTAEDAYGATAQYSFFVTVKAAPVVASAIGDVADLEVGAEQLIFLFAAFSDRDGDALTITAASSDEAIATVSMDSDVLTVAAVSNGTATITVTAQDTDGNTVSDAFDVSVVAAPQQQQSTPNQAPTVASAIADATVVNESGTHQVSLSGVFSDADNDSLTITAASGDEAVATVSVATDGSSLTVTAKARGQATITVTAADGNGGTVSDTFTVTVKAAPVVASALSDVSGLEVEGTQEVSLTGVFRDADGDALTITAASSDNGKATVTVASDYSKLTLTGVAVGTATITVSAQDSDGNTVSDAFAAPVAKKYASLIARMYEWRNDPEWKDHKEHTDRWDRALKAFGEDVADQTLTKMTADEAQGFADQGWTRWVPVAQAMREIESAGQQQQQANRAPTVSSAIADATIVNESATRQVSLPGVFEDADGDALTITAASSDDAKATVSVASDGSSLTVTARSRGQTTITVTATDTYGATVEDSFTVTVKAAPVVASALADITGLEVDVSQEIFLSGVFTDADGDALTVTAASSNDAKATVTVASDGSKLTLTGVAVGTATITVTAEDIDGNTVSDAFDAPVAKKYASLIARMYEWRNDPEWKDHKAHTDRWDRALLAFGETVADQTLTAMTADEAQGYADQGWEHWVPVTAALRELEGGGG